MPKHIGYKLCNSPGVNTDQATKFLVHLFVDYRFRGPSNANASQLVWLARSFLRNLASKKKKKRLKTKVTPQCVLSINSEQDSEGHIY